VDVVLALVGLVVVVVFWVMLLYVQMQCLEIASLWAGKGICGLDK
jgi:hypothetical protein